MSPAPTTSDYAIASQVLLKSILTGAEPGNRKTLGPLVPLKLLQVLRLIGLGANVESVVGAGSPALVFQSGLKLGVTLGEVVYGQTGKNLADFLKAVRDLCANLRLGLVVLDKQDSAKGKFTLRVDECVSCAGISGVSAPICHWEAGIVAGLFKQFTSVGAPRPRNVKAIETKCNAVGDNTCAIEVEVLS